MDKGSVQVGLDGPDVVQPVLQDHVFADSSQEAHRGVGVGVDEAWHGGFAGAVDDLPFDFARTTRGADPSDDSVRYFDVDLAAVKSNISQKKLFHQQCVFQI